MAMRSARHPGDLKSRRDRKFHQRTPLLRERGRPLECVTAQGASCCQRRTVRRDDDSHPRHRERPGCSGGGEDAPGGLCACRGPKPAGAPTPPCQGNARKATNAVARNALRTVCGRQCSPPRRRQHAATSRAIARVSPRRAPYLRRDGMVRRGPDAKGRSPTKRIFPGKAE